MICEKYAKRWRREVDQKLFPGCFFNLTPYFLYIINMEMEQCFLKFYKSDTKKVLQFQGESVIIYRLDMR